MNICFITTSSYSCGSDQSTPACYNSVLGDDRVFWGPSLTKGGKLMDCMKWWNPAWGSRGVIIHTSGPDSVYLYLSLSSPLSPVMDCKKNMVVLVFLLGNIRRISKDFWVTYFYQSTLHTSHLYFHSCLRFGYVLGDSLYRLFYWKSLCTATFVCYYVQWRLIPQIKKTNKLYAASPCCRGLKWYWFTKTDSTAQANRTPPQFKPQQKSFVSSGRQF